MLSVLRSVCVRPRWLPLRPFSTTLQHDPTRDSILNSFSSSVSAASQEKSLPATAPPVNAASTPLVPSPGPSSAASQQFMTIPPAEDPLLHMFTSCIMQHGERQKASRTTAQVLLHLHAYTRQPPLELFRQALLAAAPTVRCMSQRRGGKAVVKPIPLSEKQRMRKAIGWIWEVVNVRSKVATTGQTIAERTAREMIKILNGDSSVLKKKEQLHLTALANRGSVKTR